MPSTLRPCFVSNASSSSPAQSLLDSTDCRLSFDALVPSVVFLNVETIAYGISRVLCDCRELYPPCLIVATFEIAEELMSNDELTADAPAALKLDTVINCRPSSPEFEVAEAAGRSPLREPHVRKHRKEKSGFCSAMEDLNSNQNGEYPFSILLVLLTASRGPQAKAFVLHNRCSFPLQLSRPCSKGPRPSPAKLLWWYRLPRFANAPPRRNLAEISTTA